MMEAPINNFLFVFYYISWNLVVFSMFIVWKFKKENNENATEYACYVHND